MNVMSKVTLAGAIGLVLTPTVFAQQLEEIVVTATRRVENLQDVPISVTAVTGEAILRGGFSDMEDLSIFVPNLYMRDQFTGQSIIIRGIGTSTGNEAFEQAVAQFHDGVYYARDNLGQNSFYDLERVEVVRGPQPTFAGQSATAGALNYISRRPGDAFAGTITASYGSDEESSVEFGFGGPVTDNFGVRLAGRSYQLDDAGYTDITTGAPLGIKDNDAVRLTGVWSPSDTFELTFKYETNDVWQVGTPREHTRCDTRAQYSTAHTAVTRGMPSVCGLEALFNGATLDVLDGLQGTGGSQDVWEVVEALDAQFGLTPGDRTRNAGTLPNGDPVFGNSYTPVACSDPLEPRLPGCSPVARGLNNVAEYNFPEEREHQSNVFVIDMNWDVGDYTLSFTTSNVEYDKHDWLDPDGGTFAIFTDERIETFDQTSFEFRITSPIDQTFSWMLGAYKQDSDLDTTIDVFLPRTLGPAPPGAIAVSFGGDLLEDASWTSLFFAGTYNVTDSVRVNIGGRLQDIEKNGNLTPTNAFLFPGMTTYYPNGRVRNAGGAAASGNADADDTLPEFGIEWDAGDNSMLYLKYAEALKAGGFVMSPAIGGGLPNPFSYLPEFAEGVEFGFKSLLADGSVELNLAVYDVDYKNLQVSIFLSEEGRFVTGNAAEAHTTGVEIDGRWAATNNFTLGFAAALNEAEYDRYDGADCNTLDVKIYGRPCFNDLAGHSLPISPDYTVSFMPEFNFSFGEMQARFGAMMVFSDGYSLSNDFDPLAEVPSNHRIDVRLSISPPNGQWEVALYGRDITDERLKVGGAGSFQSKTLDQTLHDGNGTARTRGSRWGIQGSYFFGN